MLLVSAVPDMEMQCGSAKSEVQKTLDHAKKRQADRDKNTVRFSLDTVDGDTTQVLMRLGLKINGRSCQATFDTGAAYNVVTPEFAARHKLIVSDVRMPVVGTRGGMGRVAVARTLSLGARTFSDVPFLILNLNSGDSPARQEFTACECIIGQQLLRQFAAYTICFPEHTITFSSDTISNEAQGSSIRIEAAGKTPVVEVEHGGKTFGVKLDTGATRTMLGNAFYSDNKALVACEGKWDIAASSGYGGVAYDSVFRLPKLTMSVCGKPFTLHNVAVSAMSTGNALSADYGRLGVDFFRLWRKVTVDNVAMRLTVE